MNALIYVGLGVLCTIIFAIFCEFMKKYKIEFKEPASTVSVILAIMLIPMGLFLGGSIIYLMAVLPR